MSAEIKQLKRYWDYHVREGEELSQSFLHQAAIEYLMAVLKWLFYAQSVGIAHNVNFYYPPTLDEDALSPDLAVVDGLEIRNRQDGEPNSYWIGQDGPTPRIVFEIASESTWPTDLGEKVEQYAQMGINEYISFDPQKPKVWTKDWKRENRLVAWRLNQQRQYERIEKDPDGRIWSQELDSWLAVRENELHLYTREGELRINQTQAEERARILAEQRAEEAERIATAERLAKEAEREAKEAERQAKEAAIQRAEQERQAREAVEKQLADLMKKMNQSDSGSEQA